MLAATLREFHQRVQYDRNEARRRGCTALRRDRQCGELQQLIAAVGRGRITAPIK